MSFWHHQLGIHVFKSCVSYPPYLSLFYSLFPHRYSPIFVFLFISFACSLYFLCSSYRITPLTPKQLPLSYFMSSPGPLISVPSLELLCLSFCCCSAALPLPIVVVGSSPCLLLPLMFLLVLSPHPSCQTEWDTPLGKYFSKTDSLFKVLY